MVFLLVLCCAYRFRQLQLARFQSWDCSPFSENLNQVRRRKDVSDCVDIYWANIILNCKICLKSRTFFAQRMSFDGRVADQTIWFNGFCGFLVSSWHLRLLFIPIIPQWVPPLRVSPFSSSSSFLIVSLENFPSLFSSFSALSIHLLRKIHRSLSLSLSFSLSVSQ